MGLVPRNVTKVSLPHVGRYDAQILTTDQSALSATLALHIKSVLDIVVDDSARTIRAVQITTGKRLMYQHSLHPQN